MSDTLKYEIVSPERLLKDSVAKQLVLPGVEGDFAVLANHSPFMSILRPGLVKIATETGSEETLFVKGGLAQTASEGLTILAEEAIDPATVDKAALAQKISDTNDDIKDAASEQERRRLEGELAWMTALDALV